MGGSQFPDNPSVAERWDRVFRLLADPSRRELVLNLLDAAPDQWLPLPGAARSSHTSTPPQRFSLALRHQHLPALAEGDHVRWREDPFEVRRGENFEEVGVPLGVICDFPERLPNQLVYGCEVLEDAVVEHTNG